MPHGSETSDGRPWSRSWGLEASSPIFWLDFDSGSPPYSILYKSHPARRYSVFLFEQPSLDSGPLDDRASGTTVGIRAPRPRTAIGSPATTAGEMIPFHQRQPPRTETAYGRIESASPTMFVFAPRPLPGPGKNVSKRVVAKTRTDLV